MVKTDQNQQSTYQSSNHQSGKTDSIIQVENLDAYYSDVLALKGVNMKICKNQITAFIGPSGCGKVL